ncbi:unnamed protein product [Cylindrotheca closterium]|uniref:Uncharacterized protein n=1 Tax=Cylindrotheca closterium TaxID=2856 RepID=A0AAD2PWQ3_9STRA|nr:unnamed protein product [Cylindrotheca closterium]
MPTAASVFWFFVSISWMFSSGLVHGNVVEPRLLRANAKGESLTIIEGIERDSILKEFRFEKSSSSRLSTTREDAWQHEEEGVAYYSRPVSQDFSFDDSEDETDFESRLVTRTNTLLRHRNAVSLKES